MTTRKPSADEQALFREAMQGTKPIARRKRVVTLALPAGPESADVKSPATKPKAAPVVRPAPLPTPKEKPALNPGRIADLDKRTGERFKRGEMAIDAKIDLHGLTQVEAHDRLQGFLAKAASGGKRCVLVVTGKGAGGWGVLRDAVPRWLNEPALRRHLLAFAQAQSRHGGAGALYLLLKRKRDS
jgi:DNA-nicking Smr family endonuclease